MQSYSIRFLLSKNPSGITYSEQKRKDVASILKKHNVVCVEDNAYGELRFTGEDLPTIRNYSQDTILMGSFSKIIAPGLRMGVDMCPKGNNGKTACSKTGS